MVLPAKSYKTDEFTVPCSLDAQGQLDELTVRVARETLDREGFVIVQRVFEADDASRALAVVNGVLHDPQREKAQFASQTDIRFGRRDFCPLPPDKMKPFLGKLLLRLKPLLTEYCSYNRPVVEISTLTSHYGSSHQYLHHDPAGVLCMFIAIEDTTAEQGGTVFIPRTHRYLGSPILSERNRELLAAFTTLNNLRILRYNFRKLRRMVKSGEASKQEFMQRAFSKSKDHHQPNLLQFLQGKNRYTSIRDFFPRNFLRLLRLRKAAEQAFGLVQTTPRQGDVILYRSDVVHAGPDNCSKVPRRFLNVSLSRDVTAADTTLFGFAQHSSLKNQPLTANDLVASLTPSSVSGR